MIRVCSQCKRIIGSRPGRSDEEEKVSHGICSQCLAILEGKLRENQQVEPDSDISLRPKSLSLKPKENS